MQERIGYMIAPNPVMEKAFASALAAIPNRKKSTARAALVNLEEPAKTILVDCFRQFGIETVLMAGGAAARLPRGELGACGHRRRGGADADTRTPRTAAS